MNRRSKLKVYAPILPGLLLVAMAGCDSVNTGDEQRESSQIEKDVRQRVDVAAASGLQQHQDAEKAAPVYSDENRAIEQSAKRSEGGVKSPALAEPAQRTNYYQQTQDYDSGRSQREFDRLSAPAFAELPSKENQLARLEAMAADPDSVQSRGISTTLYANLASGQSGESQDASGALSTDAVEDGADTLRDEALYGQTSAEKILALKKLAESNDKGNPEVVSVFEEALYDGDRDVRDEAILAITENRVPVTTDKLFEVAKTDPDAKIRGRAYLSLTLVAGGTPELRDYLVAALDDPEPAIRESAQRYLDRMPQ